QQSGSHPPGQWRTGPYLGFSFLIPSNVGIGRLTAVGTGCLTTVGIGLCTDRMLLDSPRQMTGESHGNVCWRSRGVCLFLPGASGDPVDPPALRGFRCAEATR